MKIRLLGIGRQLVRNFCIMGSIRSPVLHYKQRCRGLTIGIRCSLGFCCSYLVRIRLLENLRACCLQFMICVCLLRR